jgi:hypothetical protein
MSTDAEVKSDLIRSLSLAHVCLSLHNFAMHDSTLDVNTWIASDNSTQLNATDLNRGPISPTVSSGASPTGEEKDITVLWRAELQPHENGFLAEDGWYRINSFQFIANDSEEFCPSNNCEYEIEEGEVRPDSFTGGYVFDGNLKVTTTEGDTKRSKFYNMRADLEKSGSEETPSKLTEIIEGDIGFGGTVFDPELEYQVVNGTLEVNERSSTLTLPMSNKYLILEP